MRTHKVAFRPLAQCSYLYTGFVDKVGFVDMAGFWRPGSLPLSTVDAPSVSSRWATRTLVRVQRSTPSWATRKYLCLQHLATPSIFRYFTASASVLPSQPIPPCGCFLKFFATCVPLALLLPLLHALHGPLTCLSDSLCGTCPVLM